MSQGNRRREKRFMLAFHAEGKKVKCPKEKKKKEEETKYSLAFHAEGKKPFDTQIYAAL